MDEKAWRRRICDRARAIRRQTGLSQMEFAHRADLSYHTVGKIERREVFPDLETLIHLSEAHQIPLHDFLGEPAKTSTRTDRTVRDLVSLLRGKDERRLDLALGLLRYLFSKL